MIQRKQSVFLLLSVILSAVCLFLPIGTFVAEKMGDNSELFNIAIKNAQGMNYGVCILFVVLLLSAMASAVDIFLFKNRKLQSSICKLSMVLLVLWYLGYAYFAFVKGIEGSTFRLGFAAVLPFISLVLTFLANKGIKADEDLIRSMDRIR